GCEGRDPARHSRDPARARAARPRRSDPLRPGQHAVVLAARHRFAGHVLSRQRRAAGGRAGQPRDRARALPGLPLGQVEGTMTIQTHPVRNAEAALLATIHRRSFALVPRLTRLVPLRAQAGDPILLLGDRLGSDELRVQFGPVLTWALPLSDRAAVALVPDGA